jgi:ABC-2 type transport system permease protein
MSADATANGVIHDIGYQRYEGPRLGRGYAVRSLFTHTLRTAYGLGRTGKAKVFPWAIAGLIGVVATVLTAIRVQSGELVVPYWQFPQVIVLLVILFCAGVAPELVSRDLRGGVLPLYFSRPLTRSDYALAKLAALVTAIWLLLAGPQTLMFLGGVFSLEGWRAVGDETLHFGQGLAVSAVYAIVFGSLSLLISSLAGRRAVAAAMVVAVFLITTPVYGVLLGIAYSQAGGGDLTGDALRLSQLAGLVSPMTLVQGVAQWWLQPRDVGPYGPVYGLVAAALAVVCVLLVLLRYRKVAR